MKKLSFFKIHCFNLKHWFQGNMYITTFSNRLIIDKYARFGSFFRSILLLLNTRISISFSNLLPHFRSSLPCDFWMRRYYYFLTLNSFFSKIFVSYFFQQCLKLLAHGLDTAIIKTSLKVKKQILTPGRIVYNPAN